MSVQAQRLAEAMVAFQAGDDAQARSLCEGLLRELPARADLWNLLGVIDRRQGRAEAAAGHFLKAIELRPDFADAHYNLGNCRKQQGDALAAAGAYRRALRLRGGWAAPWNELSDALRLAGELAEARDAAVRALALDPQAASAHNHLGNALAGLGDLAGAEAAYREAMALDPARPEFACNLATLLQRQGRYHEALAPAETAFALDPRGATAQLGLAVVLQHLGEDARARALYEALLAEQPDHLAACFNLAALHNRAGRLEEALAAYERCVALEPGHDAALAEAVHIRLRHCDWSCLPQAGALLGRVREGVDPERLPSPFALVALPLPMEDAWLLPAAEGWARSIARDAQRVCVRRAVPLERPLRIGYLSADFHNHATAHLMLGLFGRHDRTRVSVHAYSLGPDDGSAYRRRIATDCDRFTDLSRMGDLEAARRIAADAIDVLVDLKGYTRDARARIVAHRPAPLQVQYLGYPGSMGADFVDYVIGDAIVTPPAAQAAFREHIALMPHSYQVNDCDQPIAEPLPAREACGLPPGLVLACFCTHYKIEPEVFGVWMDLLRALPQALLWLIAGHPDTHANLRREAAARGVDPERLHFAPVLPKDQHLSRLRHADLFLDTLHYNGHTTASDALWAGVPVITCPGQTFASRVGASLVHAAGLPELAVPDLDAYRELALDLARDAEGRAALRARLAARRHDAPLFDTARFARDFEDLLLGLWSRAAGEGA